MSIRLSVPMVINTSYGGYGLSNDAAIELIRRKGLTYRVEDAPFNFIYVGDTYQSIEDIVPRNDPDLIDIVRTMGDKANGQSAKLKIVDVEINIDVSNYDGKETVEVSGGNKCG